jgi:Na+/proline symporter
VVNTYKVTLVAAFVPLCAGLFWKRATSGGAVCAIAAGLGCWMGFELLGSASIWPPQLAGLLMATVGMIAGSYLLPDGSSR